MTITTITIVVKNVVEQTATTDTTPKGKDLALVNVVMATLNREMDKEMVMATVNRETDKEEVKDVLEEDEEVIEESMIETLI